MLVESVKAGLAGQVAKHTVDFGDVSVAEELLDALPIMARPQPEETDDEPQLARGDTQITFGLQQGRHMPIQDLRVHGFGSRARKKPRTLVRPQSQPRCIAIESKQASDGRWQCDLEGAFARSEPEHGRALGNNDVAIDPQRSELGWANAHHQSKTDGQCGLHMSDRGA